MLGLLFAVITCLLSFMYMTVAHLSRISKLPEEKSVMEARKQLKFLSRNLLKAIDAKVEVKYVDREAIDRIDPKQGVVLVANHESNFDIPAIVVGFPMAVGFVAKKEMETWPFYSTWMKKSKCVFLDRSNPREGVKSIKRAVEIIKKGYPTVIFPEGERSINGTMGEFKKGSFKLATETNGIIIPVSIVGTRAIQKRSSVLINRGKKIRLIIGEPIYIGDLSENELKNLNKKVKNIVETNKKWDIG